MIQNLKNSNQAWNQNRQKYVVSEIGGVHFSNVTFGFTKLQLQLILTLPKPNSSSISKLVNDSLISHTIVTKSQGDFSPQSPHQCVKES